MRPPGSEYRGEFPREDLEAYDALGETGERILPFYEYMILWNDLYTVHGGVLDWTADGLGISARVDFTLTSAIEGYEKPGSELFERALARAGGVEAARAVYAGNDLVLDVQGARDAGILPVLVEHVDYAGRAKDVPEGVARVASLPELGDWILERSA